jgi:hypothetical protein
MSIVPRQPFGFSVHNEDEKAKAVGKYVYEKKRLLLSGVGTEWEFCSFSRF